MDLMHAPLQSISNTNLRFNVAPPSLPPPRKQMTITKSYWDCVAEHDLLSCTTCRELLPLAWKTPTCKKCAIHKDTGCKQAEKKRSTEAAPMTWEASSSNISSEISGNEPRGSMPTSYTGVLLGKRKAPETDSEVPAKMSSSRDKMYDQYQTGADMLDTLSSSLKQYYNACLSSSAQPPYIQFRGGYSVVSDPKITRWKRVDMVSDELKKVVKLPHSKKAYVRPMSADTWTESFQCDCSRGRVASSLSSQTPSMMSHTARTPTPPSSQTPGASSSCAKPAKRTQTSLSHWILSAAPKAKTSTSVTVDAGAAYITGIPTSVDDVPGCGGKVNITVQDDESHPLGKLVKGQKIILEVDHPVV
ncbi:hypothetical protein AcW1_006632 [Taiwanofungus camphoratus]|nr:hypothetical protein AcW2_005393 [Antrodia cinnamomea]KAI0954866.1 hypothetical protein AcW1_006632 [Antrodia cinnamomea]